MMKPLELAQSYLTQIGIYSSNESTSRWKRIANFLVFLMILILNLCGAISNLFFALKFISIDFNGSIFSIVSIMICISAAYAMTIAYFLRHKIYDVFESLATIYDASQCKITRNNIQVLILHLENGNSENILKLLDKQKESIRYMTRADQICEWLWKICFKYLAVGVMVVLILASFGSVYLCWFNNGHLDTVHFFRPNRYL